MHEFVACSFVENDTARVCGAIWVTQGSTLNLTGCRFLRNHGFDAACVGAANGSRATIRDCLFAGNSADIFSSAVAVEMRVPYLDLEVVTAAWKVSGRDQVARGRGKAVLRRLLERLMQAVPHRRPK